MQQVNWKKYVTRSLSLYKTDIYMQNLVKAYKKHFDFDLNNIMVHGKGYECILYIGDEDLKGLGDVSKNYFLDCLNNNKDPFIFLDRLEKEFLSATKDIGSKKISSRSELIKAYKEYINLFEDFMMIIWFPVMFEESFFPYVKEKLKKYTEENKAWDVIAEPIEPSIIQEEMISLLQVNSDEKLEQHKENFRWIGMRFIDNELKDIDYFKKRLKEIEDPKKELERIKIDIEKKKKRFYGLLDYLDPSEEDKKLFLYLNKVHQLRQTRDKSRRTAYGNIKPIFDQIVKFLKTDYKTLFDLTHQEILDLLEKNKTLGAPDFIHMHKHGELEILRGDVTHKLKEEGIISSEVEKVDEFKGTIACKGKVRGKVKVINLNRWEKDVAEVEKGDILVAFSTKPDYIVAMERASAFITDEGGITCHAAIIAREMNKPCLVGTSIATQILKDGDLVEVDAEKGIVRKIK